MPLVSTIKKLQLSLSLLLLLASFHASSQENSPFSRFGLGNALPARNVVNTAMGGAAVSYSDVQSINFSNPASYSDLKRYVVYDIGVSLTNRTLKSINPAGKYSSVDLLPSYVNLGMPLNKKRNMGLVLGLRPLSRISYSTEESKRIKSNTSGLSDSILYQYEGSGGLYQAFAGIGKSWGGFSVGINTGYSFGRRENVTRTFIVDSVPTSNSNSSIVTSFGNLFISGGLQYKATLSKRTVLRLGVAGNMRQKLNAKQDILRETFSYQASGAILPIDTVSFVTDKAGTIELPMSYTAGFSINNVVVDRLGNRFDKGSISVEYESSQWSNFRFYNQPENLMNSWQLKIGGQLVPDPLSIKSYWNHVAFRGGFYFGKDALIVNGKSLSVSGVSVGAGFPIRKWRSYDNQFTNINTSIEYGKRGNKDNNIFENFFRFSLGLSLSDVWFIKRQYD
jgi:hypothetical protein